MAQTLTAPLYTRRHGDANPLQAYLVLDLASGDWYSTTRGSGDGVSAREWHGHCKAFGTSPYLSQNGIDAILADERVTELAARACGGYKSVWDGHNHIAKTTPEAEDAIIDLQTRIDEMCNSDDMMVQVRDPADWLDAIIKRSDSSYTIDEVGTLTATSTDKDLEVMAAAVEAIADSDGVLLDPEPIKFLDSIRNSLDA